MLISLLPISNISITNNYIPIAALFNEKLQTGNIFLSIFYIQDGF